MKSKFLTVLLLTVAVLVAALLLVGCSDQEQCIVVSSIEDLQKARIGVETGTVFDEKAKSLLPDCDIKYYNSNFDLTAALSAGKIEAFVCDEPFAERIIYDNAGFTILHKISEDEYGFAFANDSAKSQILCSQMNEFLTKAEQDGTIKEIRDIWLGFDESKKDVDYSALTAENGVLKFGISTNGAEPFTYVKDGKYIGYEIDLAVRFCKAYGYDIEIANYDFMGLLAAIETGKTDFGGSCISITDERKGALMFSEPSYSGGVVIVVRKPVPVYSSIDDLRGKRLGVITGSVFDKIAEKRIPGIKIEYFNTSADLSVALDSGKIDGFALDDPVARYLLAQNPGQSILGQLAEDHYGVIFRKNDENGTRLCEMMNEYLANAKADGSLDKIIDAWLGADALNQSVEYENLPAENGVLTFAFSTSIGAPYAYVYNEKYAGYELAVAVDFCRTYGYGISLFDSDFTGMLSAVSLGKADFGSTGISITDERRESMLFSDPIYDGGIMVVVKNDFSGKTGKSFLGSISESFEKTFIREGRWKMFLSGIGITMLITVVSALLGSLIGFLIFLVYRKKNKVFVAVCDFIGSLFEKMPVVVILMILYYVIFGNTDISGVIVSAIGFTFLFAFGVLGLIKSGVDAVDRGQTEAALALGYTDNRAFLRVVFPQAAKHFLPGYKSAIVSLVKDTSIVGYIAVQDLTKISDIVRSRTLEAFFPLVATAVIYFLLACILILIVKSIEIKTDPQRRKASKILKGVETK